MESPFPKEVPFFVDASVAVKNPDSGSIQPENEPSVAEISQPSQASQPDEKQSAVYEQKPNSLEQLSEGPQKQPATLITKMEEKAKQPVVLNPVPHKQVPQTSEISSSPSREESFQSGHQIDQDLEKGKEPHLVVAEPANEEPQRSDNAPAQNGETLNGQFPVEVMQTAVPSSGVPTRRFTVKKVQDPVLKNMSSPQVMTKNEHKSPPVLKPNSDESGVSSDASNKEMSRTSESGLSQEPCDQTEAQEKLSKKDSASRLQLEAASTAPLVDQRLDKKSDTELPSPSLHNDNQMQISFDIQVSKGEEQLQIIPSANSSRPQTPTYAFHPVDNSNSEGRSLPLHQVKFESQISGEDLNPDKHKIESVASSDDELSISATNEKVRATSSASEYVQGRFTISASSDRPDTPLLETLDNARLSLAPVDVTLSDVTTAAVMGSVPSLTPSSSMESLNSVGSQPGAMTSHTSSSSPQTTPLEGQSSNSPSAASSKDPVRKNSGQSDLLFDGARHLLAKQEGDQVSIVTL